MNQEVIISTNTPRIIATIRRNGPGSFTQIVTPPEFHEERMLTMIPGDDGIYIVLGFYGDDERGALNELIRNIAR